ncbi:hypothetical protein [Kordia zhangzhouensis]|uniref:hypothetical protein n=1 Tax=Kordia zhangzhouensis TaxID=1620405 RepID=UPI0006290FE9|nr:hypothetical protein [Kordia zhangzhouensis]
MKKILFVAILVSLFMLQACSVDDNSTAEFQFEFIPIESVEMPQEFNFGNTHTIHVTYKQPTTCHSFSNFQYVQEPQNVRNVAVVNFVAIRSDCETLEEEFKTVSFNFSVLDTEPYTFKFWQGKDANGQDMYLIYEVSVNN